MRRFFMFAAGAALQIGAAFAQDKPIPDAASLIGKTLDPDRAYELGEHAPKTKTGDWTYGFESDESLLRSGSATERGKGGAQLDTIFIYNKRCARSDKSAPFSFSVGERFALKGSVEKGRFANAWIFFGDREVFDAMGVAKKMVFSENDAELHFTLDPNELAKRGVLALCPTAAAPAKMDGACSIFSLKGFERAYDFVCEAK